MTMLLKAMVTMINPAGHVLLWAPMRYGPMTVPMATPEIARNGQ